MVSGIGIDMIEVDRVATKIGKESGFRELVFSKKEIEYCESKAKKFEHYAARFAGKEAFLKALGTGWKNGIAFNEIEISGDDLGKPEIFLLGETAKSVAAIGNIKIMISLSHLKNTAAAVVVIDQ
ncbi:MAG: holo-ACP synthase [Bacteroidetes bacterium]|nr:holo-ACP synthase [Bacteroidota bacterium]